VRILLTEDPVVSDVTTEFRQGEWLVSASTRTALKVRLPGSTLRGYPFTRPSKTTLSTSVLRNTDDVRPRADLI
jgi:hypothetical protein